MSGLHVRSTPICATTFSLIKLMSHGRYNFLKLLKNGFSAHNVKNNWLHVIYMPKKSFSAIMNVLSTYQPCVKAHTTPKTRWCQDGTCYYNIYNVIDQVVPR